MAIYTKKKIKVLSLKIFAMRRFKNEIWYFYAKSEFLLKIAKFLIFETRTPNRHILEEIFLNFKMIWRLKMSDNVFEQFLRFKVENDRFFG